MPNISRQLRNLRKDLKLTQSELAEIVGVYKNTISRIERGIVFPDETTLKKFADNGINLDLKTNQPNQEAEMISIAEEIIKLRKNLGLNQAQFARKIGIDPSDMSRIELGKKEPSAITLRKIKEKLEIDLISNQTQTFSKEEKEEIKEGKVRLTFNIENQTFDLYYSSHKEENTIKNTSHTNTYNLVLTTEFDKFLKFLVIKYPAQIKNIQIQNIKEASLSVTSTKTEYLYLLTNKGDTVGMVKFKPSKFEDIFEEANREEVVKEKEAPAIKKLNNWIDIYTDSNSVAIKYHDYFYSERKDTSTYTLSIDKNFLEYFLGFLKSEILYSKDQKITDAYLDIYFKTSKSLLTLFGENFREIIELPLIELLDDDETHDIPEYLRPSENKEEILEDTPLIPIPKLLQIDLPKIDSTMERDVVILYKKLIQNRDQYDSTLEQIKKLVVDRVTKNTPQVKEYICKVYKQEIENEKYLEIGTVNDKDEVTFYLPKQSEDNFQGKWHSYYSKVFIKQTTWIYEDGTEELGTGYEFTPANKPQEIESSDRKGVIGYVEHKAGIVEVIYYDRFAN